MSAMQEFSVMILGREFTIACPPDQVAALRDSVNYLNRKMQDIQRNGRVVGIDRIAVMAALNMAHELLSAERDACDLVSVQHRIAHLQRIVDQALQLPP
mgnify:CR=1 FL=1